MEELGSRRSKQEEEKRKEEKKEKKNKRSGLAFGFYAYLSISHILSSIEHLGFVF